jgi:glycosyltransferase involved in cell wall biosynthesis
LSTANACFSRYDIVHFHTLGPSLFSFFPRMFGKKTIATVQGLDWQRRKWSWFARSVLKLGEWASVTLPSRTVVVSRTLQQYFHTKYKGGVTYVPNGTEIRTPHVGACLTNFGLVRRKYVLFLGRFSPEKNCDLLIDAFEQLTSEVDSDTKLVLAGGSSYTNKYSNALLKRAGPHIKILDWLTGDALKEVLSNAALFVLPSEMEGMSLSLLEAMGAGLCVLASDTPENCEVIADCGFTFQAGDVADLRRMLALLLNDEGLREAAGERARTRVEQNYLWNHVTAQIELVYRDVMSRPVARLLPSSEAAPKSA